MGSCCVKSIKQTNKTQQLKPNLKKADYKINEFSLNNVKMYGKPVYVYDGDTLYIVFDINNQLIKFNCRMMGIDSPEIIPKNITDKTRRDVEIKLAIRSRNYLIEQITKKNYQNQTTNKLEIKEYLAKSENLVWVHCLEFDKYGRLLVELYSDPQQIKSINQKMVDDKMAIQYDGGTKKQFDKNNF